MATYAKPVRLLLKDMADAFAPGSGQSFTRQQAIDWFDHHSPKIKTGTVHCHRIRLSESVPEGGFSGGRGCCRAGIHGLRGWAGASPHRR
jgi:hypothetical protein